MHRNFYQAANLFIVLIVVTGFLEGVLNLVLRHDIISLAALPYWFLVTIIINVIGSGLILTYLYVKQYKAAFVTGMLSAIAVVALLLVTFLFLMARANLAYMIPLQIIVIVTGIVYSLSLLFSRSSERPWLKVLGIVGLIAGCIFGFILIWGLTTSGLAPRSSLYSVMLWLSLIGKMAPVFHILNFKSEQRMLEPDKLDSRSEKLANVFYVAGTVCGLAIVFPLCVMLYQQAISKISWANHMAMKASEWRQLFASGTYTNTEGETLTYQLLKPLDYDSTQKYPLVVCLPYNHGVEGSPPAQLLLSDANRKRYPSFIYVPYCPDNAGWGGVPNYPEIDDLVYASIEKLQADVSGIDTDRIYVTGVSRGGYGSWHFITKRPDMFAAAVPVCGKGDPLLAHKVTEIPVWAFHGERDMNVPVSGSRDMIDAIKKAGGDPRYTEFENKAHDIWNEVTATPGLLDWLFAQKRD